MAPAPQGPLLIVGAGAQGLAHLEAFADGLPLRQVFIASRTRASAGRLVARARSLALAAEAVDDPDARLADCPLVVTCTPANGVVLRGRPRDDAFVAAVERGHLTATQFHPEKSGDAGAALLQNWLGTLN